MLMANLDAKLEELEKSLYQTEEDIRRLDRLIEGITKQKNILLTQRSDLVWKISEVKDEMDGGEKIWQQ